MNPLPVLALIMLVPGLVGGSFSALPSPNMMLPDKWGELEEADEQRLKTAGEVASWIWDQVVSEPFQEFIDSVDDLDNGSVAKIIIEAIVEYIVSVIEGVLNSVVGVIDQIRYRFVGYWADYTEEKTSDAGAAMATFNLVMTVVMVLGWVLIIRILVDAWSIVNWIIPT